MPVELLLSPPAAGKTYACIQRIRSLLKQHPLSSIWVIVPDRLQAAAFRRRLAAAGGAMGVHISTFPVLYRHLLEKAGIHLPLASRPLLHRIIQEVVDEATENGEIPYFLPLQRMPGFIQVLGESFADLKRGLVSPERFKEYDQNTSPSTIELARLYAGYQARMQSLGLADLEGFTWLAVAAMEQDTSLAAVIRLLVVDGFDAFNSAQRRALQLLGGQVHKMLVTFPGAPDSARQAHSRFTAEIAKLQQALTPAVTLLSDPPHLPADLVRLEQQLFEPVQLPIFPIGQLEMIAARSPADEAREALRWIKQRVIRDRIPLAACAVFFPNSGGYQPALRACAREFGIPISFTADEPLSQSTAITALLNLLSLPETKYNTRHLLNAIRSPYFDMGIEPQTADTLEAISRAAQIVEGRDQWLETWDRLSAPADGINEDYLDDDRRSTDLPRGAEIAPLRAIMDAVFEKLTPPEGSRSLNGWITWLEDLLEALEFYQHANGERDLSACDSFRDTLRALLQSEAVIGERQVDYAQFLADLRGTLDGIGLRENSQANGNLLLAARMIEARGLRFRAVAILGLAEGSFPAVEHPDPFLGEDLRADLGLDPLLGRGQAGTFYQAVTRADEHLLLTRPYLAESGEQHEASAYWKAAAAIFDPAYPMLIRPDDARPLVDAGSTQELLFSAVRRAKLPAQFEFLTDRWEHLRHARDVLSARRAKQAKGPHEGQAAALAHTLEQRFSPQYTWSASRLEYYGSCPYRFFITTGLKLDARAEPELGLNAANLGSVYHKVLELAYRESADPGNLESVLKSLRAAAPRVFGSAPRKFGFRPSALWEYEQIQMLTRLEDTIRALAENPRWIAVEYEAFFGLHGQNPVEIKLDGESMFLHGVIDRVDRDTQGKLRVVDYKTGGQFPQRSLADGEKLQLPIYALAAENALNLGPVDEGIYWSINAAKPGSLLLSKVKTETTEGVTAAIEILTNHLQHMILVIRGGEFPPKKPNAGCPEYCPAAVWCWRYEAGW